MPIDLSKTNLTGKNFAGVDWHKAILDEANLSETNLYQASLTEASLMNAVLTRANLSEANLTKAKYLTLPQLRGAFSLKGATMVDGKMLPNDKNWHKAFERWSDQSKTDTNGYLLP